MREALIPSVFVVLSGPVTEKSMAVGRLGSSSGAVGMEKKRASAAAAAMACTVCQKGTPHLRLGHVCVGRKGRLGTKSIGERWSLEDHVWRHVPS